MNFQFIVRILGTQFIQFSIRLELFSIDSTIWAMDLEGLVRTIYQQLKPVLPDMISEYSSRASRELRG
jgi:hypothetical protein